MIETDNKEVAASMDVSIPRQNNILVKIPKRFVTTLCFVSLVLIVAFMGWKYLVPDALFGRVPAQISATTIIQELHGEKTLNVLEAMGNAKYQVNDPAQFVILDKTFQIPGRQKSVVVTYDYKINFGVDLDLIKEDDVQIEGNSIVIRLSKPRDTSFQIYNDQAETFGGILVDKRHPMDDVRNLDPSHDTYINVLINDSMKDLKQSGKYEELQNRAMEKTIETVKGFVEKITKNKLADIKISFY